MDNSSHIYYVYAFLREDLTPYYIGKGKQYRAYTKRSVGIKPPKDRSRIVLLAKDLPESTAFEVEKFMIRLYGRKDNVQNPGILHNRTEGGEGPSGAVRTPEQRANISESQKRRPKRTKETFLKISNSLRGKPKKSFSDEHIRNMSIANSNRITKEETKLKLSEIQKNMPKLECPYCNHFFKVSMLKRWHGKNCKKFICE